MTDFLIDDQGTIVRLTPLSDGARQWLEDNVEAEPWQWLGRSLCIDHRYADDLISGAVADGLEVSQA